MSSFGKVSLSLIIPAYNEAQSCADTIVTARNMLESSGLRYEIILVDDASCDQTDSVARSTGATVIIHPENLGYGAALKSGIKHAQYDWIGIVDADGSYPIDEFPLLLQHIPKFDMVVGARTGEHYRGGFFKQPSRKIFAWLAEFVTGRRIPDVNSGMRVFRRDVVLRHLGHFSGGFSFTTTLTMAMMMEGHFIKYIPISYHPRIGSSHIRYFRDTLRASQIIVEAILHYNPIKLFLLLAVTSMAVSVLTGVLVLLVGMHLPLLLGWAGLVSALLLFAIGSLAYVVRSHEVDNRALEFDSKGENSYGDSGR